MNRIDLKFRELRRIKRKAFIAFITAGYPSLKATEKLVEEFDRVGVDIVELGVPFTDPLADGPIIQQASHEALQHHVTLRSIIKTVERIRRVSQIPICLMTYYNPLFALGEERFIRMATHAGVDGVIIPDLPADEGAQFIRAAARAGLATITFVAPTSCEQRIRLSIAKAGGFIYYVSLTGVTGPRKKLPANLIRNVRSLKNKTTKPVCVGFGVSDASQVKAIGAYADGVIVGSAIVRKIIDERKHPDLVKRVGSWVRHLKG